MMNCKINGTDNNYFFGKKNYIRIPLEKEHGKPMSNMLQVEHELCNADQILFAQMEGHYQSENERIFFETMKYKEEYELATMNDLLMTEEDNDEDLYFIRIYADEYEIGIGATKNHFLSLAEALAMPLSEIGKTTELTFGEWLKQRDYKGINYEGNVDML